MKKHLRIILGIFFAICILGELARGTTITESFISNKNKYSTGGMVWNIALGDLHPPLQAAAWDDGGGPQNTVFDVGDGRHGDFQISRYALFDQDGVITGGIIEINTDAYPDLNFTSFYLAAGYILRPVGESPLVIRVQSTVQIAGQIMCSGGDGLAASLDINESKSGGVARCGPGHGGNSVPAGVAPSSTHAGISGGTGTSGGGGGPIRLASGGQGGGGGGGYIKANGGVLDKSDPTPGDDSIGGSGGTVGTIFRDDGFVVDSDGGGSGGGGGSAFDHPGDPTNYSGGGSGGAGGGAIHIYAVGNVTVTATGEIHADGGNGGSVGSGKGGAGGGGGGGSILIFSGGDILLNGPVTAAAGLPGVSAGGDGGTGAWGRTWLLEKDGFASGAFIEDPETQLNVPGNTNYETGVTYTVTSNAIDLGNTVPTITNLPITTSNIGASTLVYDLAFSEGSDLTLLTGFSPSAGYLNAEQKRFGRFRIQIDNLNATTPVTINDLTFDFEGHQVNDFAFTTGCGAVGAGANGFKKLFTKSETGLNLTVPLLLVIFLWPILVYISLRTIEII